MTAFADFLVAPLTPVVGGLVSGIDLSRPLSDRSVQSLRQAVAERHVLFFENQSLEPAAQRDFASRFGKLHVHPVYRHVEGVPEITLIETRKDSLPDNDNWHTDVTFIETPPFGAVLTPKVLPTSGGDTLWSSLVAAYNGLSEPVRRLVDGLTAEHDFQYGFKRYLWASETAAKRRRKRSPPTRPSCIRSSARSRTGDADCSSMKASRRGSSSSSRKRARRCSPSCSLISPSRNSRCAGAGSWAMWNLLRQ
jgi:taurine dioxygenase